MIVSASQFADILGVAKQRISELIKQGLPTTPGERGKASAIDTALAIQWIRDRDRDKYMTPDDGESEAEADLRKLRADADFAEHRAALAANEVVPASAVDALLDRSMTMVAAQLDGMAGRVAAAVAAESDPAICRQIVFDEARRIRAALAAEFERAAPVAANVEGDQSAAAEDAGPVGGPVPRTAARKRRARSVAKQ